MNPFASRNSEFNTDYEMCDFTIGLVPNGDSKNDFDKWALEQKRKPYFWADDPQYPKHKHPRLLEGYRF